ncbi:MAG: hypothetical protein IK097_01915 [Clostridia bacterium]|nr:hypothetical protein [Clostridia bacterium]
MKKIKVIISLILAFTLLFSVFMPVHTSAAVTKAVITVDGAAQTRPVSDNLFGIFIEDINFACDGGLNPNQIANNSFEQHLAWDLNWDCRMSSWDVVSGRGGLLTDAPLNENNPSYFHADEECLLKNLGYPETENFYPDIGNGHGVYLRKGVDFDLTFYARGKGEFTTWFEYEDNETNVYTHTFAVDSSEFAKQTFTFRPKKDAYTKFCISVPAGCDVDFFSVIAHDSFGYDDPVWKYSSMRADLVQALKDLHPSFMRFPGGCLAEGAYDWSEEYNWKATLGELEQRHQIPNIWGYNQSLSIGYYEYFCLAEYIGATPVPVVHAGLMCQGRGDWKLDIDSPEFAQHIQNVLDLIEYANGGTDTEWGAVRAENGHPEPFNLKYLAVGNENWMEDYWERFDVIYNAIKEAHPEITVITSAGAWADGKEWEYAWEQIDEKYRDTVVDEHYYVRPQWIYENYEKYDSYDRDSAKVFVGEYAVHREGGEQIRKNNVYVAIDEAVHCTALIRNSDVVEMACYAPLFAKKNYTQWCPNLIWYDAKEVVKTPSYYVQQLYMQNIGTESLKTTAEGEGIYSAATVDPESKKIYVYAINNTKESQSLTINLEGFRNIDMTGEVRYVGSGLYNISNNFGFLNDFISPRYQKTTVLGNKLTKSIGPDTLNVFCFSYDGANSYISPLSETGYRAGTRLETVFYEYLSKFVVWFTATDFYNNYIKELIFGEQ